MLGKVLQISQNLPTLGAAMKGVGAASKALGKQLLALAANPFIAIAGVIALLVMKIVDAFKRSESETMALAPVMCGGRIGLRAKICHSLS